MNLLVLGGTQFVGRHIAAEAQRRGHTVTLFNRGTHKEVFPGLEQLTGDRNEDLSALDGRSWDAAIDTCGYVPRQVEMATQALQDSVEHYTFISTISVYAEQSVPFQDETAALATLDDESLEEVTGETYGGLKVLCERVAEAALPGRVLTVRPGIVVGPYDPTDRFTYWPERVARGGEVLAPGKPEGPVQFIDARDLAAWTLQSVEAKRTGVSNVISDPDQFSLQDVLQVSKDVSGSDAAFTWLDEAFLLTQGVAPWTELPLWIPGEDSNLMRTSNDKARDTGLKVRPLADTVRDTLAWSQARSSDTPRKAGLTLKREAELLEAWHDAS